MTNLNERQRNKPFNLSVRLCYADIEYLFKAVEDQAPKQAHLCERYLMLSIYLQILLNETKHTLQEEADELQQAYSDHLSRIAASTDSAHETHSEGSNDSMRDAVFVVLNGRFNGNKD